MALDVVLVAPEIPQNTGNIARTCAAMGAVLHLVHPLGFSVSEKAVRRAGLDYWNLVTVHEHQDLEACLSCFDSRRLLLFTSKTDRSIASADFPDNPVLVFGNETRGLSDDVINRFHSQTIRIPTLAHARCLNLSNAVAIGAYEALRHQQFRNLQLSRAT